MTTHTTPTLAREIAAADLDRAAREFTVVAGQVEAEESTQEMLRAARNRLVRMALAYAAAHGWTPPPPDAA